MNTRKSSLAALLGTLALSGAAQAVTISSATGSGGVTDAFRAADLVVPPDFTLWNVDSAWWSGIAESVTFQLDQAYYLSAATVTVDWNDVYRFYVSTDGVGWSQWFTVSGLFDQNVVNDGQVTMTPLVVATSQAYSYVRVQALLGDNLYSIGELQLSGVAAVPEPGMWALYAGGLGVLALLARRRRRL